MNRRRRLLVEGLVQGVGLRRRMAIAARELAISGWVRNVPEGHVEAEIQGESEALDAFEAWLRESPSPAKVRRMTSVSCPIRCDDAAFLIQR